MNICFKTGQPPYTERYIRWCERTRANRPLLLDVNVVEKDGMLAIDDTIVEKTGKEMYGVEWRFDHSKGKSAWGMSIADCVFIGNSIYPVASSIYVRREGRWSAILETIRRRISIAAPLFVSGIVKNVVPPAPPVIQIISNGAAIGRIW